MRVYEQRIHAGDYVDPHPLFHDPGTDTQTRAVGWHVGEVIKGVLVKMGKMSKAKLAEAFEWRWIMLLGFCWEHYVVQRIPSISGTTWQPGEIAGDTGLVGVSRDGRRLEQLYGNPDGYTEEVEWIWQGPNGERLVYPVLEEFKFTKMSSNRGPQEHWKWWAQVKAYLWMLQQVHGREHRWVRLYVCFVNADYAGFGPSGDNEPYVACWWVEFTQRELEDNWKLLVGYMAKQAA